MVQTPIKVGIVGTGYAATKRAEAIQADPRAQLLAVVGNSPESTQKFSQTYGISTVDSWQALVANPEIDLVFVCNINSSHGAIAQGALAAGKHVVVEYPLALAPLQAEALINLAKEDHKLLHVEHIELLGGVHQGIKKYLSAIGEVYYGSYSTIVPQNPAPMRWTYHREMFGFPLIGALSRITRFIDLFGEVASVNCHNRYWESSARDYDRGCFCTAEIRFKQGLIANIIYGKGETIHQAQRNLELYGDRGSLVFKGEAGSLITSDSQTPIEVASRRGLFNLDTLLVLDYLLEGKALYTTAEASYYALRVAEAARQSAMSGKIINLV
ncbi:MAG: gfo/Idh/MocA family oxidoreductase [Gloeocapsa sp. DLM2.Bin57]|nr:MAG: gfo/Idh/MocA family oxidoreductase [Gloeocapsa sp. DLM2.Bin57]